MGKDFELAKLLKFLMSIGFVCLVSANPPHHQWTNALLQILKGLCIIQNNNGTSTLNKFIYEIFYTHMFDLILFLVLD